MAAPADYWDQSDLKAIQAGGHINEDVMQKLWDLSVIPLPLSERLEVAPARNAYTEWPQEKHPEPNLDNFIVSGSDITSYNNTTGKRVGNHTQIIHDAVAVTEAASQSDTIGRANEYAHQVMKAQQRARRDAEAIMLRNQGSQEDDGDTVPGTMGTLDAWLESNVAVAAGGAVGGFDTATKLVTAATNGTAARALSDDLMAQQIQSCYENNGTPSVWMSIPTMIQKIGRYLLGAEAPVAAPVANMPGQGAGVQQTSQGYVKVMATDFNFTMTLIPNRLQRAYDGNKTGTCTLFGIDFANIGIKALYGWKVSELAKLGLSDRSFAHSQLALAVYEESAHIGIRDLDPTLAVVPPA